MLRSRIVVVQLITTVRVIAALLFASVALIPTAQVAAVSLYIGAIVTDIADGYFARRFQCTTAFGAHYDGFADKIVDVVSVIYNAVLGAPMAACVVVLARHVLTLTIRAATTDTTSGSRVVGAVNGAAIRAITLTTLLVAAARDFTLAYGIWLAAALSTFTSIYEVWIHRRALRTLLFTKQAR